MFVAPCSAEDAVPYQTEPDALLQNLLADLYASAAAFAATSVAELVVVPAVEAPAKHAEGVVSEPAVETAEAALIPVMAAAEDVFA